MRADDDLFRLARLVWAVTVRAEQKPEAESAYGVGDPDEAFEYGYQAGGIAMAKEILALMKKMMSVE